MRAGRRPGPPVPVELAELPERPEIAQLSADVLRTIGDRFFYGLSTSALFLRPGARISGGGAM